MVKLKSSLGQFYGCHYVSVNRCGISVSKMTTDIFRLSSLQSRPSPNHGITKFVISVTWRVSLVEQDLLIMLVHLSLPPVFSGVCVGHVVLFHVFVFLFRVVLSAKISAYKLCSIRLYSHLFCRGFCFMCHLYLFTHTDVLLDIHIKWCKCRLAVTRRVTLVEQKLFNLAGQQGSPPVFCGVHCLSFFFLPLYCLFWLPVWHLQTFVRALFHEHFVGVDN